VLAAHYKWHAGKRLAQAILLSVLAAMFAFLGYQFLWREDRPPAVVFVVTTVVVLAAFAAMSRKRRPSSRAGSPWLRRLRTGRHSGATASSPLARVFGESPDPSRLPWR
jgi:hypothetical protein